MTRTTAFLLSSFLLALLGTPAAWSGPAGAPAEVVVRHGSDMPAWELDTLARGWGWGVKRHFAHPLSARHWRGTWRKGWDETPEDQAGAPDQQISVLGITGWAASSSDELISKLRGHSRIVQVEPNQGARLGPAVWGGDQSSIPLFDDELSLSTMQDQAALHAIGAPHARMRATGAGTRVAILDGGFLPFHEALAGRVDTAASYDVIDRDGDVTDWGNGRDDDGDGLVDGGVGHGTAVAAIVSAVAPGARLVLVRVLDDEGRGSVATLAAGLLHARSVGVHVINISASVQSDSPMLQGILQDLARDGVLVVASVGNGGGEVGYPASSPWTAAVGGVVKNTRYDPAANLGPTVDLGAPSRGIVAPFPYTYDGYGWWGGTSMAAPLFAGAVALLREVHAGATAQSMGVLLVERTIPYAQVPPEQVGLVGTGALDLRRAIE